MTVLVRELATVLDAVLGQWMDHTVVDNIR